MASTKANGIMHNFKKVTEAKLEDMSKTKLKKRTEAKMMWGVRAYND